MSFPPNLMPAAKDGTVKKIIALFMAGIALSFLGIFLIGVFAPHPSPPIPPIRIAINDWPGAAHAFIAKEKGLFAKNGVAVELIFFKELAKALVAYKHDEVDGVFGVYSDAIVLHGEGFPAKVVYITDYSNSGDVIIGKSSLNSLKDLKGGTISFESVNSFSHIFVLKALESHGLSETNSHFELVPATSVLTALEEGRIDAGHTWQPTTSHALAKGYKILAKAGDFPGIITDELFFKPAVVAKRSQDIWWCPTLT